MSAEIVRVPGGLAELACAEETLLLKLEQARQMLAEATTLHQQRQVEGFAKAVVEWAKRQESLGLAAVNEARYLWLEAKVLQGQHLLRLEKHEGGRPKTGPSSGPVFNRSLRELGYHKQQAQRLQLMASVSSEARREILKKANEQSEELTQKAILAGAPSRLKPLRDPPPSPDETLPAPLIAADLLNRILCGDARELAAAIPDESISLCLCDPVYDRIDDYEWLARECERLLMPGGNLIVQCGNTRRYQCEVAMRQSGLQWVDLLAEVYPYALTPLFPIRVQVGWKPYLWFSKGPRSGEWMMNRLAVGGKAQADPAKAYHPWADGHQFAGGVLSKLCAAGEVVWDPFTGSGTVPCVAKQLNLSFIAFEIDPERARQAQERLAGVVPATPGQPALHFEEEARVLQEAGD